MFSEKFCHFEPIIWQLFSYFNLVAKHADACQKCEFWSGKCEKNCCDIANAPKMT